MDINTVRIGVTLLSLVLFIGLMVWAWSARRNQEFAEAEQLPFMDPDLPAGASGRIGEKK